MRLNALLIPLGTVAGLAAGLAVGFSLGRRATPTPEAAPPPERRGGLTCVQVDAPGPNPVAQLAACQAKLAQAVGPKASMGAEWPPDAGQEAPEPWTATIEDLFARCDLGYAVEAIDCAEYPCVALLRGESGESGESGAATEFQAKLEQCPAWQAWSAKVTKPTSELMPVDLRCPDGSYESGQILWIYSDQIFELNSVDGLDGIMDAFMLLGRRNESVAHQWRCREPVD